MLDIIKVYPSVERAYNTQYLDIDKKGIFNGISIELIM